MAITSALSRPGVHPWPMDTISDPEAPNERPADALARQTRWPASTHTKPRPRQTRRPPSGRARTALHRSRADRIGPGERHHRLDDPRQRPAQLRVLVKRILRKHGYPPDKQERATHTVLEQAEVPSELWAVA